MKIKARLLGLLVVGFKFQKQPPRDVLKKKYSENMQQIYRRTAKPCKATLLNSDCGMGALL